MSRFTKAQQIESKANLADTLAKAAQRNGKPIIYTVLRTVSRSGMLRYISAYAMVDNEPVGLSWDYERSQGNLAGEKFGRWANRVPGCGMDMGFHLADCIAGAADIRSNFIHEWL